MDSQKFIEAFAEAVELEAAQVSPSTVYKELPSWDSLAALSVIAMIDGEFDVSIGGDDLAQTSTVAELQSLVATRMA